MPGDALEGLRKLQCRARAEDGASRGRHRRSRGVQRHWPHRTLIAANILSVILILTAGGAYGYVQWRFGQIKRIAVGGLQRQGHSSQSQKDGASIAPFTLLVIGSDTRALGSGSSAQFGSSSQVGGQRSDSIILVRVVPKTRSLALLSIPRDTRVPIPGLGTTRINAAFDSGTPTLLVNVLAQDFGVQVNHVVEFNFDTFMQVADAVGGVEQWFPVPAKDAFSLLNVPAGCVNLTGAQALGFVRSREYQYYLHGQWNYQYYPESDLARIQRQQAFTRNLVHKAKKTFGPTNLLQLNSLIGSITRNITVDRSFSNSLLLSLAQDYRSADLSTIPSYTYPAHNSKVQPGALDPDTTAGAGVIQEWLNVGQTPAAPTQTTGPTSSTSTPPTTVIAPSSVTVEVLNGSGAGGQASAAGQEMSSVGYHVTVSGDAPNFGLATTEIEYAPDALADAQQLQSQLNAPSTLVEDSALTPTPYNLEVITGQNFAGVKGAASASTSGTVPRTTTTVAGPAYAGTQTVDPASSSVFNGVYVPPGLVPGQTPKTCGE